jgi:hypothetical protein
MVTIFFTLDQALSGMPLGIGKLIAHFIHYWWFYLLRLRFWA